MKKIILALFLLIALPVSFAAGQDGGIVPIGVGPGNNDGNETPIGGLAVLAALGGGYAVKKLRDGKHER